MSEEGGSFLVGRAQSALFAKDQPVTVEFGEYIVEPATSAGEVSFEDEVAERLEFQDVLHEEAEGARRVRLPLARAPGVPLAKTLSQTRGDGGAGEQTFGWAKRLAAGAIVDDSQAGFNGTCK